MSSLSNVKSLTKLPSLAKLGIVSRSGDRLQSESLFKRYNKYRNNISSDDCSLHYTPTESHVLWKWV